MHVFHPREGKRIVPGDFMEHRSDQRRQKVASYTCKLCGCQVLWMDHTINNKQFEMQLCLDCYEKEGDENE